MPIPKPRQGEKKDEFVNRCMRDRKMRDEYKDTKQRAAVCMAQLKKG